MFGFFVVGVALALGLFVANLRRSTLGQRMLAVRSNERAAAAAGINVRNVKLAAFGISSFIAGIAGALYGYNFSSVTVTRFSALTALSLIALAYVGGITMVSGAIVRRPDLGRGARSRTRSRSGSGSRATGPCCSRGVALIVTLIQNPDGVAGATYRKRHAEAAAAQPGARRRVLALTGEEL